MNDEKFSFFLARMDPNGTNMARSEVNGSHQMVNKSE